MYGGRCDVHNVDLAHVQQQQPDECDHNLHQSSAFVPTFQRPPSSQQQQQQPPPPPPLPNKRTKAKRHRKRHAPPGPAGVWFQSQAHDNRRRSHPAAATENDSNHANKQPQPQHEASTSTTTATAADVSSCPVWMCMQHSLGLVTPYLPPYYTPSQRYAHLQHHSKRRAHLDDTNTPRFMFLQDLQDMCITAAPQPLQQTDHRRLLVLVHAASNPNFGYWTVELRDECGTSIQAWMDPELDEPTICSLLMPLGAVWMLQNVRVLLVTSTSSSSNTNSTSSTTSNGTLVNNSGQQQQHCCSCWLLITKDMIQQVWTPQQAAREFSDADYIEWMTKRSQLPTTLTTALSHDSDDDNDNDEKSTHHRHGQEQDEDKHEEHRPRRLLTTMVDDEAHSDHEHQDDDDNHRCNERPPFASYSLSKRGRKDDDGMIVNDENSTSVVAIAAQPHVSDIGGSAATATSTTSTAKESAPTTQWATTAAVPASDLSSAPPMHPLPSSCFKETSTNRRQHPQLKESCSTNYATNMTPLLDDSNCNRHQSEVAMSPVLAAVSNHPHVAARPCRKNAQQQRASSASVSSQGSQPAPPNTNFSSANEGSSNNNNLRFSQFLSPTSAAARSTTSSTTSHKPNDPCVITLALLQSSQHSNAESTTVLDENVSQLTTLQDSQMARTMTTTTAAAPTTKSGQQQSRTIRKSAKGSKSRPATGTPASSTRPSRLVLSQFEALSAATPRDSASPPSTMHKGEASSQKVSPQNTESTTPTSSTRKRRKAGSMPRITNASNLWLRADVSTMMGMLDEDEKEEDGQDGQLSLQQQQQPGGANEKESSREFFPDKELKAFERGTSTNLFQVSSFAGINVDGLFDEMD